MNPAAHNEIALITESGKIWTTSLVVSDKFDKRHDNVLQSIARLECSAEFTALNFQASEYIDSTGRSLPCMRMTRDGFTILAMGFTGKEAMIWKERFIECFNAMEADLRQGIMDDGRLMLDMARASERRFQLIAQATETVSMRVVVTEEKVERHEKEIGELRADVIDIQSKKSKRVEVTAKTKSEHYAVLRESGCRCPLCQKPVDVPAGVDIDHFYKVQLADFANTWPLCRPCHRDVTSGKRKRIDCQIAFSAYQAFGRTVILRQGSLFPE